MDRQHRSPARATHRPARVAARRFQRPDPRPDHRRREPCAADTEPRRPAIPAAPGPGQLGGTRGLPAPPRGPAHAQPACDRHHGHSHRRQPRAPELPHQGPQARGPHPGPLPPDPGLPARHRPGSQAGRHSSRHVRRRAGPLPRRQRRQRPPRTHPRHRPPANLCEFDKEGAAATWKKGYGFHPLGAWAANTRECLAMLLRPGNAGSNTFADHKDVLVAAIGQVPARFRGKILVRIDGAGASHELIKHLLSMSSPRRILLFTCGWMITAADEDAIRQVPADAWKPGTGQDGSPEDDKDVAEITGLMTRAGNWPGGLRWIARRVKPSRRHLKNLTEYERKTGWKYSITCTNIPDSGIPGVPGSHHPQYIDVVHREHAVVETGGVRTAKAMGLRNLPSKTWVVNCGWVLAANIAAGLAAWCRLLGLYDCDDLKDAEPDTLRYRLLSLPARLVRHARARVLKISRTWPWREAFTTCWQRLCALPAPA